MSHRVFERSVCRCWILKVLDMGDLCEKDFFVAVRKRRLETLVCRCFLMAKSLMEIRESGEKQYGMFADNQLRCWRRTREEGKEVCDYLERVREVDVNVDKFKEEMSVWMSELMLLFPDIDGEELQG